MLFNFALATASPENALTEMGGRGIVMVSTGALAPAIA